MVVDLLTGVPGSSMAVSVRAGARELTAVTESDGVFTFCGLPSGAEARVEALGVDGATPWGATLSSDIVWLGARYVALTRPARVEGRVTDADSGQPIAGARVSVEAVGLSTKSDDQGYFALRSVAGESALRVDHSGYEAGALSTWLEGGFGYRADFHLSAAGAQVPTSTTITRDSMPYEPSPDAVARAYRFSVAGGHGASRFDWDLFGSEEEAVRVRLQAPGVDVGDGLAKRFPDGRVVVTEGAQSWTVPEASVQRLELRRTSSTRLSIVGTALGFAVGAVLGAKFHHEIDRCMDHVVGGQTVTVCSEKPVGVMRHGPTFAAIGGVVGWSFGRVVTRWVPVF